MLLAGHGVAAASPLPCTPPGPPGQVLRAAPTIPFTVPHRSPQRLLRTIVARLGDRALIRARIERDGGPTRLAFDRVRTGGARRLRLAWEQALVAGAVRDLLCASRASLLWSWSGIDGRQGTPDATYPYLQRFPSPPEPTFRARLATAARRWHFRVLDARYLRPLQAAPLVVVQTTQPARLAAAAGAIRSFLDRPHGAWAYEGFYFEAEDAHNVPVFALANAFRGTYLGSQWARGEGLYPFPHG